VGPSQPPSVAPTVSPLHPSLPPTPLPSQPPTENPRAPTTAPTKQPEAVQSEPQQEEVVGVTVVFAAAAGPAAVQLAILSEDMCYSDVYSERVLGEKVAWPLHPLRFRIGGSQRAGAVVGNSILLLGGILMQWAVVSALSSAGHQGINSRLKFPGLGFLAGTVLYAATTNSASWLIMRADRSVAGALVGVVGVVVVTIPRL